MIRHAMAYVQMAQNVRAELDHPHPAHEALARAERDLIAAEQALVAAYGAWRGAMELATVEFHSPARRVITPHSKKAAKYLRRSTWDLT